MKDAAPLKKLLRKVIAKIKKNKRLSAEAVADAWKAAAGEKAALHSRPVRLRRSVLTVHVDTSGWLYELTLRRREIAAELETPLETKIKEIRLRIGDI